MSPVSSYGLALLPLLLLVASCGQADKKSAAPEKKPVVQSTPSPARTTAPEPVLEIPTGGPYPALFLTDAVFWRNEKNESIPAPARLEIWRVTPTGWQKTRVEDATSNVFHKAIQLPDGGILTLGADQANLKKWTLTEGQWKAETLWTRKWEGRFNRLRDLEIGDVDGDGMDEYVMATHDHGVVAVLDPETNPIGVTELDARADTIVHEIEIGDIDGDGKMEFFATPTDRNKANQSQSGELVMYRWNGKTYVRTVVDPFGVTHAKEILAHDMDGDGTSELFSVVEAELENKQIKTPVQIRQYTLGKDGSFSHRVVATLQDRQCRFLVPGDFDGDGEKELIAAAMNGLWMLDSSDKGRTWRATSIDANSGGFEHAVFGADLDNDGNLELYVAADNQNELRRYLYDKGARRFEKTVIGPIEKDVITWNITAGKI
jgi:hypothetical protein